MSTIIADNIHEVIALAKAQNVTNLSLQGFNIYDIPIELFELDRLESLDLSNNWFRSIPKEIRQLKQLKKLTISNIPALEFLPEELGELKQLESLSLWSNKLRELPQSIITLPNLKVLNLSNNWLSTLPENFFKLTQLEELYLTGNRFEQVPYKELGPLKALSKLELQGNTFDEVPDEIYDADNETLWDYLKGLYRSGEEELAYEGKLVFVGHGGVGKTSLCNALMNPDFELDLFNETTEGIDVHQWNFQLDDKPTYQANLWDLGGQEHYRATHEFFMTKRALYLLVLDSVQGDVNFDFWLKRIQVVVPNAAVIIVANKSDQRLLQIPENSLRKNFPNIIGFHYVSVKDKEGIDALRLDIQRNLYALQHIGKKLPSAWVRAKASIEALTDTHILLRDFRKICQDEGIEASEVSHFSKYLTDVGVIIHFRDDIELLHTVILDPNWGTAAVYNILDAQEVIQNDGKFDVACLERLWANPTIKNAKTNLLPEFLEEDYHFLLNLMLRFKICYAVDQSNREFIAPQLLPREVRKGQDFEEINELKLYFKYNIIPEGLMNRLIVDLNQYVHEAWRYGCILKSGEAWASIEEDYYANKLVIQLKGSKKIELLYHINEILQKIHDSYSGLSYKEMLACTCNECSQTNTPHYFPKSQLLKAQSKKKLTIDCEESMEAVQVREIMRSVQSPSLIDELTELKPQFEQSLLSKLDPKEMSVSIDDLISMFLMALSYKLRGDERQNKEVEGLVNRVGNDLLKYYNPNNSFQSKSNYVNDLATSMETYLKKLFYMQGMDLPIPPEGVGQFVHFINTLELDQPHYIYKLKDGRKASALVHETRIERNGIAHSAKERNLAEVTDLFTNLLTSYMLITLSQYNGIGKVLFKGFESIEKLKPKNNLSKLYIQGQEVERGLRFTDVRIKNITEHYVYLDLATTLQDQQNMVYSININQAEGLEIGHRVNVILYKWEFKDTHKKYYFNFNREI